MSPLTSNQNDTAKCPECRKTVVLKRDVDGHGREREDGPLRYSHHSGKYWGRPCRMSGEQLVGDEP